MVKFSVTAVLALGATSALAVPITKYTNQKSVSFNKKGVAYTQAGFTPSYVGKASWAWNWAPGPGGKLPDDIEFVPNLHDQSSAAAFAASAPSAKHVLSFNEIDECDANSGGVCMSPSLAASLHNQYMNPLPASVKVGSPAVTSDKSKGWPALKAWKAACGSQCRVDFLHLHWYGGGSGNAQLEANNLIQYIKDTAAEMQGEFGNIPIWLTEFAPYYVVDQITPQQHVDFINAAVPLLDALDIVERYSYFAAKPGFLNNGDSTLTAAGKAYIAQAAS